MSLNFLFILFEKNLKSINFIDIIIFSCLVSLPKVFSLSEYLQILLSCAVIKKTISNNIYTISIEKQIFISGAKLAHIFYPNFIFNNIIMIIISFVVLFFFKLDAIVLVKNLILLNGLANLIFVFKYFLSIIKINIFFKKVIESIFFYSAVSIFIFSLEIFFGIALFFTIISTIIAHNKTLNFNDIHREFN